ncbi:protein of unknown function [Cupriavidus taiwanensis]|uniref:Uncharacterized protein n=1 Tax=Cupriavidus taiwanensis TaxID=164546 RepID=A0A9Q7UQZ4_9BURK|nr:protein of unknown function [Cupriavidus taiwanensis]
MQHWDNVSLRQDNAGVSGHEVLAQGGLPSATLTQNQEMLRNTGFSMQT